MSKILLTDVRRKFLELEKDQPIYQYCADQLSNLKTALENQLNEDFFIYSVTIF